MTRSKPTHAYIAKFSTVVLKKFLDRPHCDVFGPDFYEAIEEELDKRGACLQLMKECIRDGRLDGFEPSVVPESLEEWCRAK